MLLLLFVIGLCVSGIRLETLGVNFGPQQDNDLSSTMFDPNVPGLWVLHPQALFTIGSQNNVKISLIFSNNNLLNMWLQSPKLIVSGPYRTSHGNVELSATYFKNHLPGVLFEEAILSNSPLLIKVGAHKKIHDTHTVIPLYMESMKEIEVAEAYLKENLLKVINKVLCVKVSFNIIFK